MTPATSSLRVLGCDVAKDTITVFDSHLGAAQTLENKPRVLKSLFARLKKQEPNLFVVCEATGGYEAALLAAACEADLPIHRADPRKAKAFVRSLRTYGKTDELDAEALTAYGLERHNSLVLWQPLPQAVDDLQKLVRLRTDLVQSRADYKRRASAPGNGPDKRYIKAFIKDHDRRIKAVEKEIDVCLSQDDHIAKIVEVIEAIPGCGHISAFTLAGLMPELGQMSNKQAASLAGLAPHPNDTGKSLGYRSTRGGRRQVKITMFMAAMAARRFNPTIKEKYEAFLAQGKKKMVALVACARKLITIINAKIRDEIFNNKNKLQLS